MLVNLPFGDGGFPVEVDADLIAHRPVAPIANERAAIEDALRKPTGTKPLREIVKPGESVALLVNDITRLTRSDLMLPPIVDELNAAGVADGNILIVFALGIHRPQTPGERRRILGDNLYGRLRCIDHHASDEENLVVVGKTSFGNTVEINKHVWNADRIILTGEIIYHLIAGYSGGRKSLVPGVAGARTTTFNHSMIFDPRCRSGVLEGNPAHEDLLEGCRMVDPDFMLNVVLSPEGSLVKVVAGHYELAHREGCAAVDQMLRADVDVAYDLIIASAGGFPLDIDLRQAHKGLENAVRALRPGGSILFYAECRSGAGHASLEDYLSRYENDQQMEQALRNKFEIGGHKAWWIARLGRLFDVHLVSTLPADFVRRCHFQHVPPERHALRLEELVARQSRVGILPYAGFTLPNVVTKEAMLV